VPFRALATKLPAPVVDPLEEQERSELLEAAAGSAVARGARTHALEVHGDRADAIVGAARETGAEPILILIGKHGRHGAPSALTGSTGEHVVRDAIGDVLVVR
jgi:nucleotide-binding universal stress UspA family protein